MKEATNFIGVFGDTPYSRFWEFLVDSRGAFDFTRTDACELAGISWNTLKEMFPVFVKNKIVMENRRIGNSVLYVLNERHPKSVFMIQMHKAINMVFIRGGNFRLNISVSKSKKIPPLNLDVNKPVLEPMAVRM